jgi:hypothetical protein
VNRRDFLRRSAPVVLAGGVFVPQFGPWFRRLSGLFARDVYNPGPEWNVATSGRELNRTWRKVQGELLGGLQFEADEWRTYSGIVVPPGRDFVVRIR